MYKRPGHIFFLAEKSFVNGQEVNEKMSCIFVYQGDGNQKPQ